MIKVSVTNNGLKEVIYSLNITNADWVNLDKEFIFLEPGKSEFVTITFEPNNLFPDDKYTINLQIYYEDRF